MEIKLQDVLHIWYDPSSIIFHGRNKYNNNNLIIPNQKTLIFEISLNAYRFLGGLSQEWFSYFLQNLSRNSFLGSEHEENKHPAYHSL